MWESRAELEAGTVHLHANTQNAFPPHTASLNGSAQFGTVESLEHILCSLSATVGTSFPHTLCLQPRAPSRAGRWRPPALPGQANLGIQPARLSIPRPAGDKAPWPAGGAHSLSAWRLSGLRALGMLPSPGGFKELPGPASIPGSLGVAGVHGDPRSCPPPLPLCCRLPELLTSRSPGHKAQRVVVWENGWTMASSSQLSQARSPFGSVSERGAEAAPEVRPAPSQDPGPSLGLRAGRRSQATSGDFAHQSGAPKGNRRPLDLRVHTTGWGAQVCTPRSLTPPSRPLAATLGGEGGTVGAGLLAWRFVCIGPGGLRLQPPAPRAGWGGGGRTGAQSAPALAELGNGEGGQEAGGAELRGGVYK